MKTKKGKGRKLNKPYEKKISISHDSWARNLFFASTLLMYMSKIQVRNQVKLQVFWRSLNILNGNIAGGNHTAKHVIQIEIDQV